MGVIVIASYRPKPGQSEALLGIVREHVPTLRSRGLVTERAPIAMRAKDGTILEVFEWASQEAIDRAHGDPLVRAMWGRFEEACDCIRLGEVPESGEMFPGFEPVEL